MTYGHNVGGAESQRRPADYNYQPPAPLKREFGNAPYR